MATTRNGRPRAVMISMEEYRRLTRRDRQALRVEDLTDAELALVAAAATPADAKRLDYEAG